MNSTYPKPLRLLVAAMITIVAAEALAMAVFVLFPPPSRLLALLFDAGFVMAVSLPTLYLYSYRPMVRHIDERKHAEEIIRYKGLHDSLTGLPNRDLFTDRLTHEIDVAKREDKSIAVMLFDINRLKEINNTLGHSHGDQLLQQVAIRLGENLRKSDTIARLDGDTFAVLLPTVSFDIAIAQLEKLKRAVEQPTMIETIKVEIEVSIGVALYPEHGTVATELLQKADMALQNAKRDIGGYRFYAIDQDAHTIQRLALFGELRHALHSQELLLYYQPKVELATRHLHGVEALVRWRHPRNGLVPPGDFIPLAERTGLIKPLTDWVLDEALRQLQNWTQAGLNIKVAVNLSARNLTDPTIPKRIDELLKKWDIAPSRLVAEITESAVMSNESRALNVLKQLDSMGVILSLDDFGTGFSSLAYLKKLPVKELKIDQSFVFGLNQNAKSAAIVRTVIALGHDLGLQVTAEGVETEDTWQHLQSLNCDLAQGYYISRPIPPADFARWMSESPYGSPTNLPN